MLLMQKIRDRFPGKVAFLKSRQAIVETAPMHSWKEFFNQRIRWASKARSYSDSRIFLALLLVYLFNLSFLALVIAAIWIPALWLYLLGLLVAKTVIEFPFVYSVAAYFGQQKLMGFFPLFQPIHIIYTIAAGWFGQFRKYAWKGRSVR